MNKVLLTLVLAASLSGCIKLQMPDDMVTDAIEAIKGSDDEKSSNDGETRFSHTVVGGAQDNASELMSQCLAELETRTTEMLELDSPTFTVVSNSVSVNGNKAVANCTVSVS